MRLYLLLEHFDKTATVAGFLANRFIKQDYAADELPGAFRREQNFTIRAAIFFRRSNIDALQSLLDRAGTFIGCQNAFSRRDQFSRYGFQIFSFHNYFVKIVNEIASFFFAKSPAKSK